MMKLLRLMIMTISIIALLVAGGVWFFQNYQRVDKVVWSGLKGPAQYDEYYVAERFLQEKGLQITRKPTYDELGRHRIGSEYNTMLFTSVGSSLSDEQIHFILDWVAKGNTLVIEGVVPSFRYSTPERPNVAHLTRTDESDTTKLLQQAGIAIVACEGEACSQCDADNQSSSFVKESTAVAEPTTAEQKANKLLHVAPGDYTKSFFVINELITLTERSLTELLVIDDSLSQLIRVQPGSCQGDLFARFKHQKGSIIVYNQPASIFSSTPPWGIYDSIFSHNNATYLLYLLHLGGKPNRILWYESDTYPNVLAILLRYWFGLLVVLALLSLAWLWYHSIRFGPVLLRDKRQSLSLETHIKATGEYFTRHGYQNALLTACYEGLDKDIAKRVPVAANIYQQALAARISAASHVPIIDVLTVLERSYPENEKDFVQLIHLINEIRKGL